MAKPMSAKAAAARAEGFRSQFEHAFAEDLASRGVSWLYEKVVLTWLPPHKPRRYTPDFSITTQSGKVLDIETKGLMDAADRLKLKCVVAQHPLLDLRLVFQNPNLKITKRSKTTYGMWATQAGIKWAAKRLPGAWLDE